jgi:hypothetical protein
MVGQRDAAGWTDKQVNDLTGTSMAGHWFSKSQFAPITREQYDKLQAAAGGEAFALTYDELGERFSAVHRDAVQMKADRLSELHQRNSYFDNTHDAMTDVWQFGRVVGEERYGHATPKPVQMIGRAVRTSCPEGGLVLEPFLGTGTTLMAAEILGRRCCALELEPLYVDVAVRRWQEKTGASATLDGSGATFAEVALARAE